MAGKLSHAEHTPGTAVIRAASGQQLVLRARGETAIVSRALERTTRELSAGTCSADCRAGSRIVGDQLG